MRINFELIPTRLGGDIVAEYPHLPREQVTTAIDYARAIVARPIAEATE